MAEYYPHSATFVWSGFTSNFVTRSIAPYGHTHTAADVTPIGQAVDTPKKYKGSTRYELNDMAMIAFYDPTIVDPPLASVAATSTVLTMGYGGTAGGTRTGNGFVLDWNDGGHAEDSEDVMILNYTFKWEGATKPVFVVASSP